MSIQQVYDSLEINGFVILRQMIQVSDQRFEIIKDLQSHSHSDGDGEIKSLDPMPNLLNRQDLAHHFDFLSNSPLSLLLAHLYTMKRNHSPVMDHDPSFDLDMHNQIIPHCSTPVSSIPFKWLRAVPTGLFTGIHLDRVYFRHHPSLITSWIPLGNMTRYHGSLILVPKSHTDPKLEPLRQGYGSTNVGSDGTASGWLDPESLNHYNLDWVGGEYQLGDVVLVGLDTLHRSLPNQSSQWRLSCEIRWLDPETEMRS